MASCREMRATIEGLKGKRSLLLEQKESQAQANRNAVMLGRKLEEAQTIIRTVALQTQQELQFRISSITTAALEAVFPDPYEFQLQFVERGGKTEADAVFLRDGEPIDPMSGSGGGAVEIAAFSLRASAWKLAPCRATIVLDEPFSRLSRNLHGKAAEMLKEISEKLGLQIIMVTHSEELIEAADKVFTIRAGKLLKGPKGVAGQRR